ncbi:MAG: CRISPR-associated endonuclease Cas2 [Patescibacteria group bacterium]|nr:CRISPR-associated endonuclease Cas2 [Patescibacteria group bacterium]
MPSKYGTFSSELLAAVGEATGLFTWPVEGSSEWIKRQIYGKRKKFVYDNLYHLKQKGFIKEISKNGKRFISLTQKGQLEVLLAKAMVFPQSNKKNWDGKWRLVIFDIPEDTKDKRDKLRRLLKQNNFVKLQASVFISPRPLSRDAVAYLKQSKLIEFIRFGRLDELDDDNILRKKFGLLS